jgi:glycosyltransferase involved in cell wall biosynthesis
MILGIDAFNLRAGGGLTHLVELLRAAEPNVHGFERVIIWSNKATLEKIDERDWLQKIHEPLLDRNLLYRIFWQRFRLKKLAIKAGCDILFVPGGSDASGFKPVVTMSRNLLPFEWKEMRRFGWTLYTLKFLILRWTQSNSINNADGVIFLTNYAHNTISKVIGKQIDISTIIPHGIHPRFTIQPRPQRLFVDFKEDQPCRILYVSSIDMYKHQWKVAEAIALLRSKGIQIVLELIGPPAKGFKKLKEVMNRVDPKGVFITYQGAVPYEKLSEFYGNSDIGVFASSCENMPNTLLEGMAAGLPMACSSLGPMPEILGTAGIYFDPENSEDISRALLELICSCEMRTQLAHAAFDKAKEYSWQKCANETFDFLAEIAHQ